MKEKYVILEWDEDHEREISVYGDEEEDYRSRFFNSREEALKFIKEPSEKWTYGTCCQIVKVEKELDG